MSGSPKDFTNIEKLSRAEAIQQKKTTYFSVKPCKLHEKNWRYTSTSACVSCAREKIKRQSRYTEAYIHLRTPEGCIAQLLRNAKARAKACGFEYNLTFNDISWNSVCPLLNIPLRVNSGRCGPDSPTLDRLDNSKGYVPGNVQIISFKANTIKNNATIEELKLLLSNLTKGHF